MNSNTRDASSHFSSSCNQESSQFSTCCEFVQFLRFWYILQSFKINFSNSDKHFPDVIIDKLGLFCSFYAPDFSCPICLAI